MLIISAISISPTQISTQKCIIQSYRFWCTWSPHTRPFARQVQQDVPWKSFSPHLQAANRGRSHYSDFSLKSIRERLCSRHLKTGQHPCAQNWSTTILQVPYPQWRLVKKCAALSPLQPPAQEALTHGGLCAQHIRSVTPKDCNLSQQASHTCFCRR